jgi:hypothetical protein
MSGRSILLNVAVNAYAGLTFMCVFRLEARITQLGQDLGDGEGDAQATDDRVTAERDALNAGHLSPRRAISIRTD